MDNFYVDIFATKGLEYLLVILFLVTLVLFWRFLHRTGPTPAGISPAASRMPRTEWFSLADGLYYHQGHSWAQPQGGAVARVGMDDFAQRLLGQPEHIELPAVGTTVEQGERGWKLRIASRTVDLISPLTGEIVAVNEDVIRSPELLNNDPYGRGWLLEIRSPRLEANLKNLLTGELALSWMQNVVRSLRRRTAVHAIPVLQDGGIPVPGFARNLSPENWEELARELLLTS